MFATLFCLCIGVWLTYLLGWRLNCSFRSIHFTVSSSLFKFDRLFWDWWLFGLLDYALDANGSYEDSVYESTTTIIGMSRICCGYVGWTLNSERALIFESRSFSWLSLLDWSPLCCPCWFSSSTKGKRLGFRTWTGADDLIAPDSFFLTNAPGGITTSSDRMIALRKSYRDR